MHSPPRIRPKEYVQTLNLKKQRIFDIFCAGARVRREPMQKRDLFVFPKGALRRTKPNRARKARGRRKKQGRKLPALCARPAPRAAAKKAQKGRAGPAACPAPLKRVMRQNFTAEPPFSFSAPALRRPFAFVPARAAYSVGHAPAVCASTSSACPAAASLAAGWVFTWLAGC